VDGNILKERREITIVGDNLTLRHTRWINGKMYEVNESRMGQEVTGRDFNTSLDGNEETEKFKQEWERVWQPSITHEAIYGLTTAEDKDAVKPRKLVSLNSDQSKSRTGIAIKENDTITISNIKEKEQLDSIKSADQLIVNDDEPHDNFEGSLKPEQPNILDTIPESVHISTKEMKVTLKETTSSNNKPTDDQCKVNEDDGEEEKSMKPMQLCIDVDRGSVTSEEDGMRVKVLEPSPNEEDGTSCERQIDGLAKKEKKKSGRKHFFRGIRKINH